jgi:peptidoglycan/LPS O-acetylase OafA/YrhL
MGYALALNTRTFALPHNVVGLLLVPVAVALSLLLFRFVEEPARHRLRMASGRTSESGALG